MPQDANIGTFASPSATMKASNFHIASEKVVTNILKRTIDRSCQFITMMAGIILVAGVAIAMLNIVISVANEIFGMDYPMIMSLRRRKETPATFARVRIQLGES
jgi:hypothetical protein